MRGITDLHSHLVPGVDDGAPDLASALEGVHRMAAAGVTRLVTTPHLDASTTLSAGELERTLAPVEAAFSRLQDAVHAAHPDLALSQAFEVRLDVPDPDLSDLRLRIPGTRVVLVEWVGLQLPPGSPRVLERLGAGGVRPLLAHPERYRGLDGQIELAAEWRARGAWLQVNHGSLVGRYGKEARRVAARLLARGWVDLLATDFHGRPHLPLYLEESRAWFEEAGALDAWSLLAVENPDRVARGEDPLPVGPVRRREGWGARILDALGAGTAKDGDR